MKYLFLFILIFQGIISSAQTLARDWNQKIEQEMSQFLDCAKNNPEISNDCSQSVGKTSKAIYRLNDFYNAKKSRFMVVSEIYGYLKSNQRWELLGQGYKQDVLLSAQDLANKNRAVVAVYLDETNLGQLAFILPGEVAPSGSWGLRVPNSAAFIMTAPEKSYVNKGISYAFPRKTMAEVYLFARKI
ncbi:MAG: hypothetical protein AAF992_17965 [Bacteroidota bacterium]